MLGLMKNPVTFGVVMRFCDGIEERGRFFMRWFNESWDRKRALGLQEYMQDEPNYMCTNQEGNLTHMTFTLRF
jgi:hypothetical protein